MKRIILLTGTFIVALTLAACGTSNNNDDTNAGQGQDDGMTNNEDQQNNADDNTSDDQNNSASSNNQDSSNNADGDMQKKMDEIDYSDFELEVGYGKNKEYEAEIEQDNGNITADLEDEINGDDLNGEAAFNKIYPNVKKLTIDRNTDKKDAIQQALDAFNLDNDYIKFDMEITFKDGTKIEFEDRK